MATVTDTFGNPVSGVAVTALDPAALHGAQVMKLILPVEYDRAVRPGQAVEVRFQGTSIALYRGRDGRLRALEDRCAHRQLKLSHGVVEGCNLTCVYHGWSYDGGGRVVGVDHDLFGHPKLKVQIRSYPVQVRYGLIWLFPGDPALAGARWQGQPAPGGAARPRRTAPVADDSVRDRGATVLSAVDRGRARAAGRPRERVSGTPSVEDWRPGGTPPRFFESVPSSQPHGTPTALREIPHK